MAAGYTLVLHAALWLPITLLGAWYFARESLSWTKVQAEVAAEPSRGGDGADGMKIAIIGAGAGGLAAAYDLARAGRFRRRLRGR